jgi:hypothetical protein
MFAKIMFLAALIVGLGFHPNEAAADEAWRVQKSSGEVWIGHAGAQPVALTPAAVVNPGDRLRTGPNGRVLLVRGVETILVSPNSSIGVPAQSSDGTTTILQESGSILLEVEKKAQNHFEVETPYLVAVVKGTQFQVSVDRKGSKVDVLSGQVEVADLRSGQVALVLPGQVASVLGGGVPGLSLSGSGVLNQIREGQPRAPRVPSVVPIEGRANGNAAQPIAIKQALGDVKVDFQKVTKGLVRAETVVRLNDRAKGKGSDSSSTASNGNGASGSGAGSNGNGNSNGGGNGNGGGGGLGNASSGSGGSGGGLGLGGGNGGGNGNGNGGGGLGLGQTTAAVAGQGVGIVENLGNGLGNAFGKLGCKGKGGC